MLTASILFHIVHASFFLDFWSIWPDKTDLRDAMNRMRRFFGKDAPSPSKFAKYPLENKLYHGVVMLAGLAVIATGLFMMKRVQTGIFMRNPYLFSDMTWGLMYVLHGLAGVGFIALITGARLYGSPAGEAAHHEVDDLRLDEPRLLSGGARYRALGGEGARAPRPNRDMPQAMATEIERQCETIEACYEFTLSYAARGLPTDEGSDAGRQLREHLTRAAAAMRGLEQSCAEAMEQGQLAPAEKYEAFFPVLKRDAARRRCSGGAGAGAAGDRIAVDR